MGYFIVLLLFASALASSIPTRICLDECICEQDESNPLIRCENGNRKTIQLPSQPMSGYEIIAIPCNDVRNLPSVELLVAAFPDLKAIDVEGNPNLDCSQISALRDHVVVNSDCGKPIKEHFQCTTVDDEKCDWKCRTMNKIKELWRKLKEKLGSMKSSLGDEIANLNLEDKMQDVQNWFHSTFNKIKSAVNQ